MSEETTPSAEVSATQQSSTPTATVTPATSSATPDAKPVLTVEELQRQYAELENKFKNADEERTRHRKKLSTYEEAERKQQEAALSEVEKANKARQDLEVRTQQLQAKLVTAHVKLAAQAKGIIDPDLAALAIQSDLELDDDGMPSNLDKALEKLMKAKPYLVAAKAEPASEPAQTAQAPQLQTPNIPAMNPGRKRNR